MKRSILFALFSLVIFGSGQLLAQDDTKGIFQQDDLKLMKDTLFFANDQPKLVLIPFEPTMYRSEIDRFVGEHDGLTFQQVREGFRRGLDNALYITGDQKYSVVRLMQNKEEVKKDLYKVYGSTAYDYRVLPKPEEKSGKGKKLLPKRKKKEEEEKPQHGTYIRQGQVVSHNDGQERFMARKVQNPEIFDELKERYGGVLFVFINQLDIRPMKGLDYRAYEQDEFQREIKVHYSVYTMNHEIYSGIATQHFSSQTNGIKDIIGENFLPLAEKIYEKVPPLVKEKESNPQ